MLDRRIEFLPGTGRGVAAARHAGGMPEDARPDAEGVRGRSIVEGAHLSAPLFVMLNSFQHPLQRRTVRVEKWTLKQVQGDGLAGIRA
jgi:hypothetical protein